MGKLIPVSIIALLLVLHAESAYSFQIDAEADARHKTEEFRDHDTELYRASLGLRHVFSDVKGDRLLLLCWLESRHNFKETSAEQAYAQYKGPMGRWNITAGKFLIPFGLAVNYDTEPLLVDNNTEESLEIKYDSGIKVSGQLGNFDYAASVTQGIDESRILDNDRDKLAAFRTGIIGDDFEDFNLGLSGTIGSVFSDDNKSYKKLIALDSIKYYDLFVFRAETIAGKIDKSNVYGVFFGTDYMLFPSFDLNISFNAFKHEILNKSALFGITYNTPFYGFVIRAAHKVTFEEKNNESFIQVYNKHTIYF